MFSFFIIQAPPGDMLTSKLAQWAEQGEMGSGGAVEQMEALRERYGLNDPVYVQYLRMDRKYYFSLRFRRIFHL